MKFSNEAREYISSYRTTRKVLRSNIRHIDVPMKSGHAFLWIKRGIFPIMFKLIKKNAKKCKDMYARIKTLLQLKNIKPL